TAEGKKEGSEETPEEVPAEASAETAEPEQEEETPPEPEPFVFAGKEYESQEKAEQFVKSYLGQVGSLEKKNAELQDRLIEATERLTRVLQEKPTEGPAKPKEEAEPAKPLSMWDALNRDEFTKALEEGDTERAADLIAWTMDQVLEGREARLKQTDLADWQTFRSRLADYEESRGVFEKFSESKDDKGSYLYPEFHEDTQENREFLSRVAVRWQEMPGRDVMIKEGNGVYGAYLCYLAEKDWQQYHNRPEAAPEEPAPEVSEPEKPQRTPASGVSTGSGMPRAAVRGSRAAAEAQILSDLDAVMKEDDPTLGL
ncbi:MAG: hypothetical protein ACFFFO_17630, partial [Candidatus Thorarchaeota archaeon]